MKANEFIKKFGLEYAKHIAYEDSVILVDLDYNDLKRLIESHELVESYMHREEGQWFFIADYCKKNRISPFDSENYEKVKSIYLQAIKDVESCQ